MNKEKIDTAIKKRKRREHGFGVWWDRNGYKVMRVVLWFIWIPLLLYETCINLSRKRKFVENPEKTKKLFDKAFPKIIAEHYDDPSVIVVMFINSDEWFEDVSIGDFCYDSCLSKRIKKYFKSLPDWRIEQLLLDCEIDGYNKIIVSQYQDWNKVVKFFDWSPYFHAEHDKAVIFYDKSKYPTFDEVQT